MCFFIRLVATVILAMNGVAIATNCWQVDVTLHYTVGPDVVTLQQSEANNIMNEVLNHVKTKLTCSGLTLTLVKVTVATPGNQYAIKGTFGVIYGNMNSAQKTAAYTCLGHAQIYSDIVRNPDQYTSPIANTYSVDRASVASISDTICCTTGLVLVNSVCVSPSVSLLSSVMVMQNATSTQVQTIHPNSTKTSLKVSTIYTTSLVSAVPVSPTAVEPVTSWTISPSSTAPSTTSSVPSTTSSPSAIPTSASPLFPVLRCYKMDLTLLYTIPQNLSISKLNPSFLKIAVILITSKFLTTINSCKSVKPLLTSTNLSRLGNNTVVASVTLKFSAKPQEIPDNELERTLTLCLNDLQQSTYKSFLQNSSIPLTVLGVTLYEKQSIQVHPAVSCCTDSLKLPCCPGNSIKESMTSCAPLNLVNYVASRQVRLGDTVMASCAAMTVANVKLSWKRNKEIIPSIHSALNYTLIINNVAASDAGLYQCEIQSDFQVITKPLYIIVVVLQEVEMTLKLDDTFHRDLLNKTSDRYKTLSQKFISQIGLVLRKETKGFDKIEVQLFKEGSVVVVFKIHLKRTLTSPISSPPDLQSEVISVMINQARQGNLGNLSVNSLILKVKPPPPLNVKVIDRGTTYITLSWQPPIGWQSYQITSYIVLYWINNEPNWKTLNVEAERNSIKITNLLTNTIYQFQVVSRSTLGDSEASLLVDVRTLTVNPIIANNGQNFTVTVGRTVVLVCQGSSNPRPEKVTWIRKVPSADFYTNITGNGKILNNYMVIYNVSVDESGSYGCSATYKDITNEGAVNVIVNVPVAVNMNITLKINFTDALYNQSSEEYQTLSWRFVSTLSNLYKNNTDIEILGFRPGSVKVSFRVIIVVKIDNPKAKGKQSEAKANATNLLIKQVEKNDGELGGGLIVKKDSIQTDAPPNPPRNVTVSDVRETSAHLAWSKPEYAELFAVTHYAVQLKQHGDQFTWDEKVTTSYVQLDCPLENLQDDTGYNVKVVAKRSGTYGLGSKQTEFETDSKKTPLLWLWILIAAVVVVATVVIGILWCRYRKKETDGSYGHNNNANKTQGGHTRMCQSDIRLNSYNSLGIMPGKWWEIPRASLTFGEVLGSGAFGLVRKAQLDTGDRFLTCAVKMLKKLASDEEERDLIQELEIMGGVGSHSNLVNLIGACTQNGPLMIVLEFAEKGSLLDYLKLNTIKVNGDQVCSLADEVKLSIALDIAKGMQHLANVKCVHRDLATRNVLLTERGQAKISDFGLSRDVYERGFYQKTTQGKLPVRWMAPEAITKMLFTTQSDVWSYGIVLWEVETGGKVPYAGVGGLELVNHLNKGYRLQQPASCIDDVYNIMTHCWYINPDERPNFDEIFYKLEEIVKGLNDI